MKMSKIYMPTLREVPADAEIPSHELLLRAGMIRKLVNGIYAYLPLGLRVLRKVEGVVRDEMEAIGSQELLMSLIQPKELLEASGRWKSYNPEMWKTKDRNSKEFCVGLSQEESFTNLIKDEIKSYKQLPLNLYQIQSKFKDEKTPRFGLVRSRENIIKDAYSFDTDETNMQTSHDTMWQAYERILSKLKLEYKVVESDLGLFETVDTYEFIAMSSSGESQIACCHSCGYSATSDKATVMYNIKEDNSELLEMERVFTPDVKTIEDLFQFLNVEKSSFAKALIFMAKGEPIVVLVPGDRELSEIKLAKYLDITENDLEMADELIIQEITGADMGFAGPVGLKDRTKLIIDSRITKMKNMIVGGNETDYHIKNVNYGRDFVAKVVEDLLTLTEGDICPKCGEILDINTGIGLGSISKDGTKFSDSIGAKFLDENGKEKSFYMGSYNFEVSKAVAAIVEQFHDDKGINWPLEVAPYQVIITVVNIKNQEQLNLGENIYHNLISLGLEVLLDDRNERAGVKFNDRDLIGIPIRVTVGKLASENIVEYSLRSSDEKEEVTADSIESLVLEELKR